VETANACGAHVIVANDPDADRMALAERSGRYAPGVCGKMKLNCGASGSFRIFNGNETAALLGWWMWTNFHDAHPEIPASQVRMLFSTVSSRILESIGRVEGFSTEVPPVLCCVCVLCVCVCVWVRWCLKHSHLSQATLTGFKWMGNRADSMLKEGLTVLFSFEEAIGESECLYEVKSTVH
jgi:hypothetical protein